MKSMFILGDSISKGVVLDEEKNRYKKIDESFTNILKDKLGFEVKNTGKFGATVKKGVKILGQNKAQLDEFDYTIIEFGGNDCNYTWSDVANEPNKKHEAKVTLDEFEIIYEELVAEIIKTNTIPIVMTLPPLDSNRFFNWISQGLEAKNILEFMNFDVNAIAKWHENYNAIVEKIANKYNLKVCDVNKAFKEYKDGDLLCSDGMHPNEEGHKVIAESLIKIIA